MLSNISWQEFMITLLLAVACYYLVIGFMFYRAELATLLKNYPGSQNAAAHNPVALRRVSPVNVMGPAVEMYAPVTQPDLTSTENDEQAVATENNYREVFKEIKQGILLLFREISRKEDSIDELKIVLPAFLEGYDTIAESRYRSKVNDYILEQCHTQFSFNITEDEINDLW